MIAAATDTLDMPVPFTPITNSHALDSPESDCYHEGDSIVWWLNQVTEDHATQHKKAEILNRLATGHYETQTRMDIGDHVNTPLEALLLLTEDENADVRFALAENHNIHENVLRLLSQDSNPYVAHRAQKTLARMEASAAIVVPVVDVAPIVSITSSHPQMYSEAN